MTDDITSPSGSATPTDGTPVTGNASGGATPPTATLSLEEAMKRIADYEHKYGNATEELERHRKKLTAYEKAEQDREAAKKAAEEAQLSEIERVKKQHADIQAEKNALAMELQEFRITNAVERYARELHFIYPEDAVSLLKRSELEFDEGGVPTNVKQLLEKLAKARPRLVDTPAEPPATPATTANSAPTAPTRPAAPALPAMNPGRTQIAPPTTTNPGKPVRLSDVHRRP